MDYNSIFRERTKRFCIDIIKKFAKVKYSDEVSGIRKQIFCSATSVAANYRAIGRARSDNERFAKMCIVVEEANETLFWLEISKELDFLSEIEIEELMTECEEILKVMLSYKKRISPHYV